MRETRAIDTLRRIARHVAGENQENKNNMKIEKLVVGALLLSAPAHAASFSCTGGILDYAFLLTGSIAGNKVPGPAHMRVTKGGNLLQQGDSAVVSSSFVANHSFGVQTRDAHSQITVTTSFSGGSYDGTMAINSDQGNTSVATRCSIR